MVKYKIFLKIGKKFKGIQNINDLGGTEASKHEFPHQALLGYLNGISIEWNCGGSLVSSRFVLTGKL